MIKDWWNHSICWSVMKLRFSWNAEDRWCLVLLPSIILVFLVGGSYQLSDCSLPVLIGTSRMFWI